MYFLGLFFVSRAFVFFTFFFCLAMSLNSAAPFSLQYTVQLRNGSQLECSLACVGWIICVHIAVGWVGQCLIV